MITALGAVILAVQIKAQLHSQTLQQQSILQGLQEQLQTCLSRLDNQGQTHMQLLTTSSKASNALSFNANRMHYNSW